VIITDPTFTKPDSYGWFDRLALRYIRDERDLPFIHLMTASSLVLFPLAALMYVPSVFRWWMAPIYWVILIAFFLDRFILMLHNTSHRPLFKKKYGLLNRYIPWILGPFFGETPETYFAHHLGMHHAENNMHDDLSSTLRFRRDRLPHFLRYFGRFFFVGVVELSLYFYRRRRYDMMWRAIVGEGSYIALVVLLAWVNFGATFTVLIFPFMFTRFAMMAGNWAQHAFVDPDDPENNYRNSLTCINTRYNRRCFNDGYHIGHHLRANRHWTDMPVEFQANIDKYAAERAIVFDGVDFFQVWFLLMTGQHRKLASHMVDLGDNTTTMEERLALMDRRLGPTHVAREEQASTAVDAPALAT